MSENRTGYICSHCGNVYSNYYDLVRLNGGEDDVSICYRCSEYYCVCERCGCLFDEDHISFRMPGGNPVCDRCSDHYTACDECGEMVEESNVYGMDDESGNYYCYDCYQELNIIQEYSYKPRPEFSKTNAEQNPCYYGVELEIDNGRHMTQAAREIDIIGSGLLYLKRDGSLNSTGFEIVTHPLSVGAHQLVMAWREILKAAASYGYRSHNTNTCGLHIHASRDYFGASGRERELNIAKVIILIERFWEDYIVPFSRRRYESLNQWAKKPNVYATSDMDEDSIIDKCWDLRNDRYNAVNLCNRDTIEFRFFRGTMRYDTLIASIQFIDTLIKYCASRSLKDVYSTVWPDICAAASLSYEAGEYIQLVKYLKGRNIWIEPTITKREEKKQCV